MPEHSANAATALPFTIRAVQLDLARQMETVDYIYSYADFAAAEGFNTLVLYLEGRIRTTSFPFRPTEHSYTLEDMEQVVQHARSAGLEVVPAISTLAHGEQFVSCDKLAHLAEERDGQSRFGGQGRSTFCPSLSETYEFLRSYLSEVMQVFTGPHLHVGLDEDWNLGYCDLCRKHWRQESLGALFTSHVSQIHQLCQSLGKRVWMWDDMYELFPDELEHAPRDIVMCHWGYDPVVHPEGAQAHFANRWRQDWLALYERMGFETLICPRETSPSNIVSFTDYARRHKVLGGLLTQWEMSHCFPDEFKPAVSLAGRLWSQRTFDPDRAWEEALEATLPNATGSLRTAVRSLQNVPRVYSRPAIQSYLAGMLSVGERLQQTATEAGLSLLRTSQLAQSNPEQEQMVTDIEVSARLAQLHWELRETLPAIYDPRWSAEDQPRLQNKSDALREELDELIAIRAPQHNIRRPGMHPEDGATVYLRNLRAGLEPAWERLNREPGEDEWWLVLRLFLPDAYGSARLKVSSIRGEEVQILMEGCFKPPIQVEECHHTLQVPFCSSAPDAIRVEVCGYGGQGITFLEVQSRSTTRMPSRIRAVEGEVTHPEAVLRDDSTYTYLGHTDVTEAVNNPSLAEQVALLEVELAT